MNGSETTVACGELLVAEVSLDARAGGAEAIYTYLADETVTIGRAHLVPLGARHEIGFVTALRRVAPADLGFDARRLKPLGHRIEGLDLPAAVIDLLVETARTTLSTVPNCIALAVPPGIRERLFTEWRLAEEQPEGVLSVAEAEVVKVLQEKGELTDRRTKPVAPGARRTLAGLEARRVVTRRIVLGQPRQVGRSGQQVRLIGDEAKIEGFLRGAGRRKPAQSATLLQLRGASSGAFTIQEIKALAGVSSEVVDALIRAGLLEEVGSEPEGPRQQPPVPNRDQEAAIHEIESAIQARRFEPFLLYGVTGSGKTEVYLRVAEAALKSGRQILYLVPEIALTAQVISQLRERFGPQVAVVHSNLTPGQRLETWLRIRAGKAPIVLGARSALFAPFESLGLIVVDEEHEGSYKQDKAPRYDARVLAKWLAQRHSSVIVSGSATPSLEAYYEATAGKRKLARLPNRTANARLPEVEIVDLGELYRTKKPAILSPRLEELIEATLERQEQAILFLNRRAYAPFLICRDCGHRATCPNCSVSLAFHRRANQLLCHQCGHTVPASSLCPECQGEHLLPFGIGAERVEEAVASTFPHARVARLDRDVAARKGALDEILTRFRLQDLDILVGTQMVAKGLDFPKVTLVGVIAADVSLAVPDFRSSERTFQLLSQVAGRAGRGVSPGRVVIQTLNPRHPSIVLASEHDYESFFLEQMSERQGAHYPPLCRLVNVIVSGPDRTLVTKASHEIRAEITRLLPRAQPIGPASCPIEKIQQNWRRHVLVKLPLGLDPTPLAALARHSKGTLAITIDVDPNTLA
ncbi:MAG: primosomal protein N' [Fimbriimonadaceae bacterium]|nr:primosomal protein N' [Fimbriimonadaceae bacterium]QYK56354.1 MAG: primosomal protein N' [Fimbriimonadaceae bacterium]